MGSGGCRIATPLDVFVEPARGGGALPGDRAALPRSRSRAARATGRGCRSWSRAWGVDGSARELEQRLGAAARRAPDAMRGSQRGADHLGIHQQKQAGPELRRPARRGRPRRRAARCATSRASPPRTATATSGSRRAQNIIIPNVPDARLPRLTQRAAARGALPHDPPGAMRGLVACTGIDYCHFALIETKEIAVKTADDPRDAPAARSAGDDALVGCPAGCGNHAAADIGLLGKNIRVNGEMVEAVDVFIGGRAGPNREGRRQDARGRAVRRAAGGARNADSVRHGKARACAAAGRRHCPRRRSAVRVCERLAAARSRCSRAARATSWRPWSSDSAARRAGAGRPGTAELATMPVRSLARIVHGRLLRWPSR